MRVLFRAIGALQDSFAGASPGLPTISAWRQQEVERGGATPQRNHPKTLPYVKLFLSTHSDPPKTSQSSMTEAPMRIKSLALPLLSVLLTAVACDKKEDDTGDTAADEDTDAPTSSGGGSGAGALSLPLVSPPVQEAAPTGLLSADAGLDLLELDPADIKSRFFEEGPTAIFNILKSIDGRIAGINEMSKSSTSKCLTQTPVLYAVTDPSDGSSWNLYAQCYQMIGDTDFIQFGTQDGVTYLYEAVGATHLAATLTPVEGAEGKYLVRVMMGVGYQNAASCSDNGLFSGCSYGLILIQADSEAKTFEMSVAGVGFGYCGARLRSDGTNLLITGSADMGETCVDESTSCLLADTLAAGGSCEDGAPVSAFELPALGRKGFTDEGGTIFGAHAAPNITLDGTHTDALGFGPFEPTEGLGEFSGK
jgi:hypothetical protein